LTGEIFLQGLKEHGKGIANLVVSNAHSGPQSSPQSLIKRHCLARLPASSPAKRSSITKQHLKSKVAEDTKIYEVHFETDRDWIEKIRPGG